MTIRAIAFAAVLGGLAAPPAASAQSDDAARTVWDFFAETCGAVVESETPAMDTARLPNGDGGAGQSEDGLLSIATVQVEGVAPEDGIAILNTTVNLFDGGRSVQCMLQLPQPIADLVPLIDIARAEAGTLLGGEVVFAGGPVGEVQIGDGLPSGLGETMHFLRASRGGFPPDAVLVVQVVPVFASLNLSVAQPSD